MTEIKSTKDYSIFKKLDKNRDIESIGRKNLKTSIITRNLLYMRPIDVTTNMEVIDGQNRLEIAKELGLEIFYRIKDDYKDEDIILLNIQKKWSMTDYLNFYSKKGKEDYIKLTKLCKDKDLNIFQAMSLLNIQKSGNNFKRFTNGEFKFPQETIVKKAIENLHYINAIQNIIKSKTIGSKGYLYSTTFIRAISVFLMNEEADRDYFVKKLEKMLSYVHKCTTSFQYLEIWQKIYNYRSSNPVEFLDDLKVKKPQNKMEKKESGQYEKDFMDKFFKKFA